MEEENMPTDDGSNIEGDTLTVEELEEQLEQERDARAKAEELANNYKIRAEKAEKHKPEPKLSTQPTNNGVSREEAILFAKGFSQEEVEYALKVAKVEDASLLAAAETPMFKAWKQSKDEESKSQKASVGVSRRGQSYEPPKDFNTVKTREEHMALFKKMTG